MFIVSIWEANHAFHAVKLRTAGIFSRIDFPSYAPQVHVVCFCVSPGSRILHYFGGTRQSLVATAGMDAILHFTQISGPVRRPASPQSSPDRQRAFGSKISSALTRSMVIKPLSPRRGKACPMTAVIGASSGGGGGSGATDARPLGQTKDKPISSNHWPANIGSQTGGKVVPVADGIT